MTATTSPDDRAAPVQAADVSRAYDSVQFRRRLYSFIILLLAAWALFAGLWTVDQSNAGQFSERYTNFFDYPREIIAESAELGWGWFAVPFTTPEHPALRVPYIWLLIETINMAIISTLLGFMLAFLVTFFASGNLVKNKTLVWTMRRILDISRAFPEIVLALFLIYLIGKNPVVAVAAIAFHSIGALGKLFSEVVENADMRPVEGLRASGANWIQRVWFGVVPQVMPNFLSYTLLRLEINVRASAILGFVGAGGLGQALKVVVDVKYGADITAILFMLIITIFAIDYLSARTRRALIGGGGR